MQSYNSRRADLLSKEIILSDSMSTSYVRRKRPGDLISGSAFKFDVLIPVIVRFATKLRVTTTQNFHQPISSLEESWYEKRVDLFNYAKFKSMKI
jgi:hypothetical protein